MSDVDKSSFPAPNPEAALPAPGVTETQIPHSGKLGLEQPVREFDNTSLSQASESGLITTPDSPAALEAPAPKKSRAPKIFAAAAAVAAVGAGAFALGNKSGGSEAETADRPAATAAPNEENPPAAGPGVIVTMPENSPVTTVQVTPETTEAPAAGPGVIIPESPATTQAPVAGPGVIVTAPNTPETQTQEYAPVVMDGTTAQEVVDQLFQNYDCMTNAPSPETQIKCLNFIFGSESQGSLIDQNRQIIDETIAYREVDPQYFQTREYTVIDSKFSDSEVVAVIQVSFQHHTANGVVDDPLGQLYQRLTFRRGQATTEEIAVEDTQRPAWLLRKVEILEEGETTVD